MSESEDIDEASVIVWECAQVEAAKMTERKMHLIIKLRKNRSAHFVKIGAIGDELDGGNLVDPARG